MQSATEIQLSQTCECRDNTLSAVTETRVEKHTTSQVKPVLEAKGHIQTRSHKLTGGSCKDFNFLHSVSQQEH